MLPGAIARHDWSPAARQPVQRIGDITRTDFRRFNPLPGALTNAPDRGRATGPAETILTDYWADDGGARLESAAEDAALNPYAPGFRCRDAWFMGATHPGERRWGKSFAAWAAETHPECHAGGR